MYTDKEKIAILKEQLEELLLKSRLANESPYDMYKDEILEIKMQVEKILHTEIRMVPTETPQRLPQQRKSTFLAGLNNLRSLLGIVL